MKDNIQRKIHRKFADELDDIKVKRIKSGIDTKLKSDRRLTLAVLRHSWWKEMKQEIIDNPLEEA